MPFQCLPQHSRILIFVQIDLLIFQCPEEPFHVNIVQRPLPSVHADAYPVAFQQGCILPVGEMSSLVGIPDLRTTASVSPMQTPDDGFLLQGTRQFPDDGIPAVCVDDHKQVHIPFLHPDAGDIHWPYLVRFGNRQPFQQVWPGMLPLVPFAQIPLRIHRTETHTLHQMPYKVPANGQLFPHDGIHSPVPMIRMGRVDPVDPVHGLNVPFGRFLRLPHPIQACPVHLRQCGLAAHRYPWILRLIQSPAFGRTGP